MHQDTLHTAPAVQTLSEPTPTSESTNASAAKARPHHTEAVSDSVPPTPRVAMPLPEGMPTTTKLNLVDEHYWEPGAIHFEPSPLLRHLDSISGRSDTLHCTAQPQGMPGEPVPYRFQSDTIVTVTLLLVFFLAVWNISRSRHYLKEQVKNFFRPPRRDNLFTEKTQKELRNQTFFVLQTCFILSILFFDYTQERMPDVFHTLSPYLVLGASTAVCGAYYVVKLTLQAAVNCVFFDATERRCWNDANMLGILGLGLGLLPVGLLVVYFAPGFTLTLSLFICILVVIKTLLFVKCKRTFFSYAFGGLHLLLYLCALEIVPLLLLFRALEYASRLLLTVN